MISSNQVVEKARKDGTSLQEARRKLVRAERLESLTDMLQNLEFEGSEHDHEAIMLVVAIMKEMVKEN